MYTVGMQAKKMLDRERNGRKALMPYATSIIDVGIHVICICTSGTQNVLFFDICDNINVHLLV